MDNASLQQQNSTPEELKTRCAGLWLQRYADIFRMYGKTLENFPQRLEGFLQVLSAVPLAAMDAGFAACLNTCVEFPVPQEVEAAAVKWQLEHRDDESVQKILDRPDKPADFERPRSLDAGTIEWLRRNSGVTKEEIAKWPEEGKAKARARYALLEADPKWRAQAAAVGVPEYRHLLTEAKGLPHIPADPDERRRWARDKAVTNGWVEAREPGDKEA